MAIELPDFEDLQKLIDEIRKLSVKKSLVEIEINKLEAETVRKATENPEFFQQGKPLSATYVKSVYEYSGINGEILPLRISLAEISAELEAKRLMFGLQKDIIDIWRSEQANQRISLSV